MFHGWLVLGEWAAVRVDPAVGSIHSPRRNLASSFTFVPLRRASLCSCQPQGSPMFCIRSFRGGCQDPVLDTVAKYFQLPLSSPKQTYKGIEITCIHVSLYRIHMRKSRIYIWRAKDCPEKIHLILLHWYIPKYYGNSLTFHRYNINGIFAILHLFALVSIIGIRRRCIRTWERSIYPRRPAPDIPDPNIPISPVMRLRTT